MTTYTQELINCNGATGAIVSSKSCLIPIATLRASPFNLPWGSSIYAYVRAQNNYGVSDASSAGNGAVILRAPDVPTTVLEISELKTATSIALSW